MSEATIDLTLAGKTFGIRPLTLRQIRDIEAANRRDDYDSEVDRLADVIGVLLSRDYSAEIPEGGVMDMEITAPELVAATETITKRLTMPGLRAAE